MSHFRLILNKNLCLSKYDSEVISNLFQPYNTENINYNIDTWCETTACVHTEVVSFKSPRSLFEFSNYLIRIPAAASFALLMGCFPEVQLSLTTQGTTKDFNKDTNYALCSVKLNWAKHSFPRLYVTHSTGFLLNFVCSLH